MKRPEFSEPPEWFKEFWNESLFRSKNTSGHRKLVEYFEEIIRSEYFRVKCKEVRKKYKIPENGFASNPKSSRIPKDWIVRSDSKTFKMYRKDIDALCNKFKLHRLDWGMMFEDQIRFGKYSLEYEGMGTHNLIMISDVTDPNETQFKKYDDKIYPIALRISPYASKRDILNFVEQNGKYIKSYQFEHIDKGIKLGKFHTKKPSLRERNDFIYEHRNLTRKELVRVVGERFGPKHIIDQGHIGKIISNENKKRKEL